MMGKSVVSGSCVLSLVSSFVWGTLWRWVAGWVASRGHRWSTEVREERRPGRHFSFVCIHFIIRDSFILHTPDTHPRFFFVR